MIIAEATQRLRLPLLSKDGDIHEEEIEKSSILSRSSFDSTTTSFTISSTSTSPNYAAATSTISAANNHLSLSATEVEEPEVGGVPNCFLGITPAYLWKTQLQQAPFDMVHHYIVLWFGHTKVPYLSYCFFYLFLCLLFSFYPLLNIFSYTYCI